MSNLKMPQYLYAIVADTKVEGMHLFHLLPSFVSVNMQARLAILNQKVLEVVCFARSFG
jgi:hypothetical protein